MSMRIYTRTGDDGTTGLLFGGRVAKDSVVIETNGAVDEAQAALGMVRAEVEAGSELDDLLVGLERDLYVLMAEVATAPANRTKLKSGVTLVTEDMVTALEMHIDSVSTRFPPITDFVIPGHDRVSAGLDVARTVTRRAERVALAAFEPGAGSWVGRYLNRLSDLLWAMARWQEQGDSLRSRAVPVGGGVGAAVREAGSSAGMQETGARPGMQPTGSSVGMQETESRKGTRKADT
ncbi:MAG TPA: cob(I)yrinic acid a,c-diamide adenosyltransferase [Acidimicrobiales bacterium]|jgi:cob(I)alamin adenosyltransferase|nr:cob(I)yrinic acid a,c-diamide adenosyltransferase [Acidimicrobiales bacterium]